MADSTAVIDVHSHFYPEIYLDLLEGRHEIPLVVRHDGNREFVIFPEEHGQEGVGGRPIGVEYFNLADKLKFMDEFGIEGSVLSLGNPWLDPFPDQNGDEAAREINRTFAAFQSESGGRVAAMGVLPTSSAQAAIAELEAIQAMPGLVGVVTGPRIAGYRFDNPELAPFWRALGASGLPLFIHPKDGVGLDELDGYRHTLPVGVGFPVETTIALTRLIFGGVMEREPALRLVVAHGGGCLPYLAGRLEAAWRSDPEIEELLPKPPIAYLRQLYLDGLVYYEPALTAAAGLVGKNRIMFGTDHPFSVSDPAANLLTIEMAIEDENEKGKILGGTAAALYGL